MINTHHVIRSFSPRSRPTQNKAEVTNSIDSIPEARHTLLATFMNDKQEWRRVATALTPHNCHNAPHCWFYPTLYHSSCHGQQNNILIYQIKTRSFDNNSSDTDNTNNDDHRSLHRKPLSDIS